MKTWLTYDFGGTVELGVDLHQDVACVFVFANLIYTRAFPAGDGKINRY